MIYNFLSVYGIYYPSGSIETRAKWRIYVYKYLVHVTIETDFSELYISLNIDTQAIIFRPHPLPHPRTK